VRPAAAANPIGGVLCIAAIRALSLTIGEIKGKKKIFLLFFLPTHAHYEPLQQQSSYQNKMNRNVSFFSFHSGFSTHRISNHIFSFKFKLNAG
jgi:hypothetical protein